MKNFGSLFAYEMKKLLRRKLNWVAIFVLSGFCIFGIVSHGAVGSPSVIPILDANGNETGEKRVISGEEIYSTYQKTEGILDGRVMDDAFFREVLENVPDLDGISQDVYFWTEDATYSSAYEMMMGLCAEPRSVTAEEFYAAQWEQTRLYCENWGRGEQTHGILSKAEVNYWMEQTAKIQRPFIYCDDWRGTNYLMDYFPALLDLLPVVGAVCVCAVFSEDRRNRMDALVFSTKRCRIPLYLAKILAGSVMAALAGLVIVASVAAAFFAVWGTHGLNAIFQMYYVTSPRPNTVWQVLLPMLVILVLYTLLCGGVSLLVSALTRSAIVALAVPVLLAQVLDRWHSPSYGWAGYLPENLIGWNGLHNVDLVNILGIYLNNFQFGPLLYLSITAVLLSLCWIGWQRSATGKI